MTVGALPVGLSLNAGTGEISGTPTTAETANFTVEVTDSQGVPDTDTQALSITVDPSAPQQYVVTLQQGLDGYTGWEDAWLTEDNPTTNYGTMDKSHLQYATVDRQLHKFDLSSIPSGATIDSASLEMYVYKVTRGTPPVTANRVITPWQEMQVTFNDASTGVVWGAPGLQSGVDYESAEVGAVRSWFAVRLATVNSRLSFALRLVSRGGPRITWTRERRLSPSLYRSGSNGL